MERWEDGGYNGVIGKIRDVYGGVFVLVGVKGRFLNEKRDAEVRDG